MESKLVGLSSEMSLAGPGCFDAETMEVRSVSLGPLLIVVGVDEPEDRAVLSASSLRKASNSRSNLKDSLRDELLASQKRYSLSPKDFDVKPSAVPNTDCENEN